MKSLIRNMQISTIYLVVLILIASCQKTSQLHISDVRGEILEKSSVQQEFLGQTFVSTGNPIPIKVEWENLQEDYAPLIVSLRICDYRDQVLIEEQIETDPSEPSKKQSIQWIFTIPETQSAREIVAKVRFIEASRGQSPRTTEWIEIFRTLVIVRQSHFRYLEGWEDVKKSADNQYFRWMRKSGSISISKPSKPLYLLVNGYAPIECFENGALRLSFGCNHFLTDSIPITSPLFSFIMLISADSSELSDETILNFVSNAVASKSICKEADSNQELSIKLTEARFADFVVTKGLLKKKIDDLYLIAPEAEFKAPGQSNSKHLYIQGERLVSCQPQPQNLSVFFKDRLIYEAKLKTRRFCEMIDFSKFDIKDDRELQFSVSVEPFFFQSNCYGDDSSDAIGLALQEIAIY
jgi:hypothetical protein